MDLVEHLLTECDITKLMFCLCEMIVEQNNHFQTVERKEYSTLYLVKDWTPHG